LVQVIVPAGEETVPGDVSKTVAVQRVVPLSKTGLGVQLTAVEVERLVAVNVKPLASTESA
jgi:hypothetical protein